MRAQAILSITFFLLLSCSSVFSLACSGISDFEAQYSRAKGFSTGSLAAIDSFAEIKNGTILQFSGTKIEKFAQTAPLIISLETSNTARGKIYYALATAEKYYSTQDYAGLSLFSWADAQGIILIDGIQSNAKPEECAQWPVPKDAAMLDLSNYPAEKPINLLTAIAMRKGTYFVLLCAPADVKISVSVSGGLAQPYELGKGVFNSGENKMVDLHPGPEKSQQEFIESAKSAIQQEKACIEDSKIKWNLAGLLQEALSGATGIGQPDQGAERKEPPQLASVTLSPEKPTQNDDLKCTAEAFDPSTGPMTFTFTWKKDGSKIAEKKFETTGGTPGLSWTAWSTISKTSETGGQFIKAGQKFECIVTAKNAFGETSPKSSGEKTITEGDSTAQLETPPAQKISNLSVFFSPASPLEGDELKCNATVSNPENRDLIFSFSWKVNGQQLQEKSYTVQGKNSHYEAIAKENTKEGQKFECTVKVSDSETTLGPTTATISMGKAKPVDEGKGEEPDKDQDGVPDASDQCPLEKGKPANKGCPERIGAPCTTNSDCQQIDCSSINCPNPQKACTAGKCACNCVQQPPPPEPEPVTVPKANQIVFLFVPIDWQGTEAAFHAEVEGQIAFLREKSGIASASECSKLEFVKKEFPKTLAGECGLSVSTAINIDDFLVRTYNCMQQKAGIALNNKKIIFAGLTDLNPAKRIGGDGLIVKDPVSGMNMTGILGFHLMPDPSSPAVSQYANTKVTMAIASNVTTPNAGFQPLSHETGHCIGFCEQYSLQERVRQDARFKALGFGGCTNKYPGAYQAPGSNIQLFFDSTYEKCPNEIDNPCPEIVALTSADAALLGITEKMSTSYSDHVLVRRADFLEKSKGLQCTAGSCTLRQPTQTLQVQISGLPDKDCLGRRFFENGKEMRDLMGPGPFTQSEVAKSFPSARYASNPERSFDCFEKQQFIKQWCLGG